MTMWSRGVSSWAVTKASGRGVSAPNCSMNAAIGEIRHGLGVRVSRPAAEPCG